MSDDEVRYESAEQCMTLRAIAEAIRNDFYTVAQDRQPLLDFADRIQRNDMGLSSKTRIGVEWELARLMTEMQSGSNTPPRLAVAYERWAQRLRKSDYPGVHNVSIDRALALIERMRHEHCVNQSWPCFSRETEVEIRAIQIDSGRGAHAKDRRT